MADETGQPVAGVQVKLDWSVDTGFGYNSKAPAKKHAVSLTSDANGHFSGEGGVFCDLTATKDGYYTSTLTVYWELKSESLVIPLKRIRHPQPMVGKQATQRIPIGNSRLQYDFVAGDCLPPLGNGVVADLEIEWTRPGVVGDAEATRRAFDPRVIGVGNGAIPPTKLPILQVHSSLSSLHEAPPEGYEPDCNFDDIMHTAVSDVVYIKIRSGQPGGPFFGKMYGPIRYDSSNDFDWFHFVYVVNPSGGRGLEMDMKRLTVPAKHGLEYPPHEF